MDLVTSQALEDIRCMGFQTVVGETLNKGKSYWEACVDKQNNAQMDLGVSTAYPEMLVTLEESSGFFPELATKRRKGKRHDSSSLNILTASRVSNINFNEHQCYCYVFFNSSRKVKGMLILLMELVAIPVLLALLSLPNQANAFPQVPCYFVFGDSLSDNGNNNNLPTLAKINYPPYGIDFPQGPTGRFCNGRNMHDFIAQLLEFKDNIPAFATSRGRNIFNGVNYAPGSAGIRNETRSNLGVCIPLNRQIKNHKTIISKITRLMGNYTATNLLLKQCIYSFQIGSNDYINNYFKPEFYDTNRRFTPSKYATLLVQQLSLQLKTLYNYGARKFVVYGIGEIGCTPYAISMYRTNRSGCVSKLNKGATLFNNRLKPLIHQLNNNLNDAKFTYLYPSGGPDLATLGHLVRDTPCCTIGDGGGELCLPHSKSCKNSSKYVFWDGVHPTETLNKIVAKNAYTSKSPLNASPLNIQQLAIW
ncbi:hypothetical protein V6N13_068842 [Hibiscus sabdariffa]|uniref:GDSL esterase/lipase n=1 Tax=Hibiscus sabdariffa TaxID=183260 RepID=A0ABR2QNU1_9ROSI